MNRALKLRFGKTAILIFNIIRIVLIILAIVIFVYVQNNVVFSKKFIFESNLVPKTFVGYRIVQVSDLSNSTFNTFSAIKSQKPDVVVFTGNFSDTDGNCDRSIDLAIKVAKNYKTAFILGDLDIGKSEAIIKTLTDAGAIYLGGTFIELNHNPVTFEDFSNKYIEKKYKPKNSDDPNDYMTNYLEYTKYKLEQDQGKVIELSGLNLLDSPDKITDAVVDAINLDSNNFKTLALSQIQYLKALKINNATLILTGNTYGKDRFGIGYARGLYDQDGMKINVSNGIGKNPDGGMRFLNIPSISTIVLSDGTINKLNLLEKVLSYFIYDVDTRFENDGGFTEYKYNIKSDRVN